MFYLLRLFEKFMLVLLKDDTFFKEVLLDKLEFLRILDETGLVNKVALYFGALALLVEFKFDKEFGYLSRSKIDSSAASKSYYKCPGEARLS